MIPSEFFPPHEGMRLVDLAGLLDLLLWIRRRRAASSGLSLQSIAVPMAMSAIS